MSLVVGDALEELMIILGLLSLGMVVFGSLSSGVDRL